jgi:pimeloyl-ACP methyl ester carboxylesterase
MAGVIALVLVSGRQAGVPVWRTLPPPAALPMADETALAPVDDIMMWYAIYSESRGHGRSTRSEKPYSYHLMADDYIGLLDYLKIGKVALVGWSDGGIIGLDIAMRHPERLTQLWAYGANTQVTGLKEGFDRDPVVVEANARQRKDYERLSPTADRYDGFMAAINHMWNTRVMRPIARQVLILAVAVGVVWLSASPLRGWLVAAVVLASVVLGVRASIAQKRVERRWMRSLWVKWKSII